MCRAIGIEFTRFPEECVFEHWTVEEPSTTLPLGLFEAQPVQGPYRFGFVVCVGCCGGMTVSTSTQTLRTGKRALSLHFQATCDGDAVNLVLAGNTWAFRQRSAASVLVGWVIQHMESS